MADLVKSGVLGRLEVVNIEAHPEVAADLGVRSVPWVRIGDFELSGPRSREEWAQWAQRARLSQRAGGEDGMADYFHTLLNEGDLAQVWTLTNRQPSLLAELLPVIANPAANITARIGASAVFESFTGAAVLVELVPQLALLAAHADHRVRADACYILGLSRAVTARPVLTACLDDADADVREIATEALAELAS